MKDGRMENWNVGCLVIGNWNNGILEDWVTGRLVVVV